MSITSGRSMPSPSTQCKNDGPSYHAGLTVDPRYNTFASAGSDGTVSIWDHKVKKRLRQLPKFNNPIPSIAFNCDGTKLAMGVSYTWDDGEEGAKTADRPAIFVRKCGDELKVINSFMSGRDLC